MKRLIIFSFLLLPVLASSQKKTLSQVSEKITSASTMLTDSVFGKAGTSNAKWMVGDERVGGGATGTQGNMIITRIQNTPYSSTSPTTGQIYQFNGTSMVPVTMVQDAVSNGVTGVAPSQNAVFDALAAISGGVPAATKTFTTASYAATINLDFNSLTNTSITATGDISFTNSNVSSGEDYIVKLVKNTSSNINITFPTANWTAPSINNNAPGMATTIQSSPPGFTLTGATGTIYNIYVQHLDLTPVIYLNLVPNFYEPSALQTNVVVWDGRAAFADPGNTTTETSVYQVMIPAGTMKPNSRCTVRFAQKRANSGESNVQFKVRAGTSSTGTANSIFYDFGLSNNGITRVEGIFQNNNSTSSQVCTKGFNSYPQAYDVNETTLSIPTGSSNWYIDITIMKTNGANTGAAGLIEVILSNI